MSEPDVDDALDRIANERHSACDHGVTFDETAASGMTSREIRKQWPRLFGPCPKGCGFSGIGYASYAHYISGDW